MLNSVVQAAGRATRSKKDHAVTYILDATFLNIVKKVKNKLPNHFIERIH
jgi:Rad3-related DNA helicase